VVVVAAVAAATGSWTRVSAEAAATDDRQATVAAILRVRNKPGGRGVFLLWLMNMRTETP
jgi:hypothetical protein